MAKEACGDDEIFVMGGAQIYAEALSVVDRLYITRVERDYEGDTSFPEIDYSQWQLVSEERYERGEEFDSPFAFLCYDRAYIYLPKFRGVIGLISSLLHL